jgi:hypothetical protein
MGTDAVLSQMRRRLQDQGVSFGEVSMAISAELGVSLETLWAYDDVESAIHRYQVRQLFPHARREHPDMTGELAVSRAEQSANPSLDDPTSIGSPPKNASKRTGR